MTDRVARPPQDPAQEKITFPCHACGAKNRFPVLKIHEGPKCGRCKAELQQTIYRHLAPIALLDKIFDPLVMASKIPAFVIAISPRDPRTADVLRHLQELFARFRGKILFAVANVAECPLFAHRFRIRETPSFLMVRRGLVIEEAHGMRTPGYLATRLETLAGL